LNKLCTYIGINTYAKIQLKFILIILVCFFKLYSISNNLIQTIIRDNNSRIQSYSSQTGTNNMCS